MLSSVGKGRGMSFETLRFPSQEERTALAIAFTDSECLMMGI